MHKEFEVHILNETGIDNAKRIGEIFNNALNQLLAVVPDGRERSIVRTKLEEAAFFAKKGMASDPANQKDLNEDAKAAAREQLIQGLKLAAKFLDDPAYGKILAEAGAQVDQASVIKALANLA